MENLLTNPILIVDDTPTNLEVISEVLNDAGYEIAIATSGERALQQIERQIPALILLDVMMPKIDGFETCKRLKNNPRTANIPIIFMTALADVDNKVKGLELGAIDYITKPFQEKEVLARVKTHLRLRQTEEKLRQSEERLESILNSLEEVVWSASLDPFKFLYINAAIGKIYQRPAEDFLQEPNLWFDMIHPEDRSKVEAYFQNFEPQSQMELEFRILNPSAQIRWLRIRGQLAPSGVGAKQRIEGIMHDVSDRKQFEMKLIHDARHDNLTGLGNRNFFIDRVNATLEQAKLTDNFNFAVLFVDLDRFKKINDSLGHMVGDRLLIKVAQILRRCLRQNDIIARLGGDEFTILLDGLQRPSDALLVAERIGRQLKEPMELDKYSFFITASIGIALGSIEYREAEEILRDADIAMYQAKKQGKARHQLFNQNFYKNAMYQVKLEQDLRLAIDRQEFILHYQPIVELATERLVGFEALVRWIHPERGLVSPADFIPLAEESGTMETLGEILLRQACSQLRRWQDRFGCASDLTMSVNLSCQQLQSQRFLAVLDGIIAETGVSREQIKLEITESLLMENSEATLEILQTLQQWGVGLSLDDFGTGYSSLSYLHRFPIDTLKIDRSFINRMDSDLQSREIVKTIIALAQTLKMKVVAEGVETAQQAANLKDLQCALAQGYFFSKPLPADRATQWIGDRHVLPLPA